MSSFPGKSKEQEVGGERSRWMMRGAISLKWVSNHGEKREWPRIVKEAFHCLKHHGVR